MSFTIVPILLIYLVPTIFIVWSILTIIKQQRENNELLKEVIQKLKDK